MEATKPTGRKFTFNSIVKELLRHARNDNCLECQSLLRAMGFNPDKPYEEQWGVKP